MANKNAKVVKNVPGKFYVDQSCISCGQCNDVAGSCFAMDQAGTAYVTRQPSNDEELQLCLQALSGCPVEAIGEDG